MQLSPHLVNTPSPIKIPSIDIAHSILRGEFGNVNAKPYRGNIDAAYSAPFCDCQVLIISCNSLVASCVVALRGCTSPAAILRTVAEGIVNPVKGKSLWSIPHVIKESLKPGVPLPGIADSNPPASVSRELLVSRAVAPMPHFAPRWVQLVFYISFKVTMLCVHSASGFFLSASARCGVTIFHVSANGNSSLSTIANTIPLDVTGLRLVPRRYNKPPKAHTNQVNEFWHFVTSKYFHLAKVWQVAVKPLFRLQTLATGVL